jgi:hypothetical protein
MLELPDEETTYTNLRHRLLWSHKLTDFPQIKPLFQMKMLGSRKLSELLGKMAEICHRG